MMFGFPASYAGRCGNCGEGFVPGDQIGYADDTLIVVECCGDDGEPRPVTSQVTPAGKVMPRGRSARDRCGACFQVPASNGVCGCS